MRRCVVVGKPNVGKTLFVLNFARYLGNREILMTFENSQGEIRSRVYVVNSALRELTGETLHLTRETQSLIVDLPVRKGREALEILDTTGLSEGIHNNPALRRAMAQTLVKLSSADITLHVVDAVNGFRSGRAEEVGEVDREVYLWGRLRGGYCILANKMDLPGAREGVARVLKAFPGCPVIPISALTMEGFKEVRRFVQREL